MADNVSTCEETDLRKRGNRALYLRGEPGGPARADQPRGIPTARPSGSPLLGRSAVLQGRGEGLRELARFRRSVCAEWSNRGSIKATAPTLFEINLDP